MLAALPFPLLGQAIGFDTTSGEAFGIFAGTAVNDTSSVTAAASTGQHVESGQPDPGQGCDRQADPHPGYHSHYSSAVPAAGERERQGGRPRGLQAEKRLSHVYSVSGSAAPRWSQPSVASLGVPATLFSPLRRSWSKFLIIMAMAAIGLNSNIVKLVKSGGKPLLLGASLLGGYHGSQPADAACDGHLVMGLPGCGKQNEPV